MASEPDVTRVLTRMGRAEFGYRTFDTVAIAPAGGHAESGEPGGLLADDPLPTQTMNGGTSAATVFSLLGSCIPEAATVTVEREAHPASSRPPAPEPEQVTHVGPLARPAQTEAPDAASPTVHRLRAVSQQVPSPQDSAPENVRDHPLFARASVTGSNPFPPRLEPQGTSAGDTISMATVFRVLTNPRSGSQSSRDPVRPGAGFSFRRG